MADPPGRDSHAPTVEEQLAQLRQQQQQAQEHQRRLEDELRRLENQARSGGGQQASNLSDPQLRQQMQMSMNNNGVPQLSLVSRIIVLYRVIDDWCSALYCPAPYCTAVAIVD